MEATKFVVVQDVPMHKSCTEPMLVRKLRLGDKVEAAGDVEDVGKDKWIPIKLQDGTLGAVNYGYLKELPLEYDIGEKVWRRMKGDAWGIGHVTSVDPLMVTFFDSPTGEGYRWDEVQKFKEAMKEKEEKEPKRESGFFSYFFPGSKNEKANSKEATPANYGSTATSDKTGQTEQKLQYAGTFGGEGDVVGAFAVVEGVLCCFATLFLYLTLTRDLWIGPGIFLAILCCMHCCIQCAIAGTDPAGVYATLGSLEQGMSNKQTAAIFEELRSTPAAVNVFAQKYHTETRTEAPATASVHDHSFTTTEEVIDHSEREEFHYASWKDVSGSAGLHEYKVVAVEVVPQIHCADRDTTAGLKSLTARLEDACRQHPRRGSVRSGHSISLNHPKYGVQGSRVFVTHSDGEMSPMWMNRCAYAGFMFAFPGLGAIYRHLLFTSLPNARYYIKKRISINRQEGAGWAACQDV